jgi:hypothetical protein
MHVALGVWACSSSAAVVRSTPHVPLRVCVVCLTPCRRFGDESRCIALCRVITIVVYVCARVCARARVCVTSPLLHPAGTVFSVTMAVESRC